MPKGNFIPHVRMMDCDYRSVDIARQFGLTYVVLRKVRPYDTTTLNYNWQIWETKAFSLYTNQTDNIDEKSAMFAVRSILRFMSNVGIINHKIRLGYNTEIVDESSIIQMMTDCGGIFRSDAEVGQFVEKGEEIGEILNPLDCSLSSKITAKATGIIYFKYDRPLINCNTVCFKIIRD